MKLLLLVLFISISMNPIQVFAQEDSGENLSEIDKLYKSLSPEDQKRIETEELDEAIKSGRVKTGVRVKEGYGVDLFVGAKFGLGTTRIGDKKEGVFETNPLAGLFIGLNGERIGFMIEGIWSMDNFTTGTSLQNTGQNIKNQVEDSLNAWSFKFHKISIPVLINFKLTEHFWLQTGPQFSAPLSNIADFKTTGNELFIDGSKAWVTGFWLNVGKSRYLPKLNLGARYALGLDGILDGRTNNINELSQFQLHLGLSY